MPDLLHQVPHVAFEVDDLAAAIEGREVLIPPTSPSAGVSVAVVIDNGAPVELLQTGDAITEAQAEVDAPPVP